MKTLVLGTAILSAAALVSPAVAQKAPAQNGKALVHVSSAVVRSYNRYPALEPVPAKLILQSELDSKYTAAGSTITARLGDTTRLADGTVLPHGTQLLGHVEAVKASDKKSDGSVTVTFDRARLKDGSTLPVKATIVDVAAAPDDYRSYYMELDGKSPLPAYPVVTRIPLTKGTLGVNSNQSAVQSGVIVCKSQNVSLDEGAQLKVALVALSQTAQMTEQK